MVEHGVDILAGLLGCDVVAVAQKSYKGIGIKIAVFDTLPEKGGGVVEYKNVGQIGIVGTYIHNHVVAAELAQLVFGTYMHCYVSEFFAGDDGKRRLGDDADIDHQRTVVEIVKVHVKTGYHLLQGVGVTII